MILRSLLLLGFIGLLAGALRWRERWMESRRWDRAIAMLLDRARREQGIKQALGWDEE